MIIISTADDHLSPFIWNSHRAIAGDAYYAMGMITKEILQIKAKAGDEEVILLKAGDIFDTTTPDPYTEQILKMNMEVLVQQGIKILSVQGNHEYHVKTARAILFGTTPLSAVPLTLDGISFCGIDYTASTEELHEKVSMIPPCDYLVMHTPFRHLLGFEGKWQLEASDIPAHVKNVIVGDIHKQSLITSGEGVNILSPGSSHPRDITKLGQDHGMYVHKHEDGISSGHFVNVEPRRFYCFNIKEEKDLTGLKELGNIRETGIKGMLPSVIVIESVGDLYKTAVSMAETKCDFVITKEILTLDTKVEIGNISDVKIPTLLESIPHVVNQKQEPEVFSTLEKLLTTDDPESVLDSIRNNYIKEVV